MRAELPLSFSLLIPILGFAQSSSPDFQAVMQQPTVQEISNVLPLTLPDPVEAARSQAAVVSVQPPENAALNQASPAPVSNFSVPITFNEYPTGSAVTDQYMNRGIIFGGSGAMITLDGVSASSPVLTGTPLFEGDITGQFVVPGTTEPAPVYQLTWDIGYFDDVGTVQMEFFGPQGQLLYSSLNTQTGFSRYTVRGGSIGIASWRFHIVSTELAGFGIDNLYFSNPGQDDLGREKGEKHCSQGNPVNPAVGNKYQRETDYRGARQFPLIASRAYNSIDGSWQFFPEIVYVQGEVSAQLIGRDGKTLTYTHSGLSTWRTTSPDITGVLESSVDGVGAITGWRYSTLDDQVALFDGNGRLMSETQRTGVSHTYTYTANEITLTHSFGGSLVYSLDSTGTITGFTDPAGNSYEYSYQPSGLFSAVSFPTGGGSRIYHYEDPNFGDLLTGITDGNGNRFASWAYDSDRRAISSEHGTGVERVTFDYTFIDDPDFPQTKVTNALGKQTTYHYITVNGARKVYAVTGHASANCVAANQSYGFDANAFIASRTDWEGNVTTYARNSKGQELSRTEAQGTPQERKLTTQWHPDYNVPLHITEPGRETTYSYDSNGNQLSESVLETTSP